MKLKKLSTCAPQGCVFSLLLFSLYNYTAKDPSVKQLKFADDIAVIGPFSNSNESAYRWELEQLAVWCSHINLKLNILKTVEMIVRGIPEVYPLSLSWTAQLSYSNSPDIS